MTRTGQNSGELQAMMSGASLLDCLQSWTFQKCSWASF